MAETMQFDLVSPERSLASFPATSVQIPGSEGDMTAMPDHAPIITTLRPGILSVEGPSGRQEYIVTGGFAEISAEAATVLAERAYPKSSEHRPVIEGHLSEAQKKAEAAPAEHKDMAQKAVADLVALLAAME